MVESEARGLPGGPVVKIPTLPIQETRVHPVGELRSYLAQKKKKKEKKVRPKRVSREVLAATVISSHSLCVALVAGSFLLTSLHRSRLSLGSYPGSWDFIP